MAAAQIPALNGTLRSARAHAGAGALVGAATVAVNGLAYVVPMLAARRLTAAELGALAALLAVAAVAGVVGVGLQTALAVRWARHHSVANADRISLLTAGVATGTLLLATPVLALVLDVPVADPALVAVMTCPMILAGRWLGELQGRQRYGRLAVGMVLLGIGRYGGVLAALLLGMGVTASLGVGTVVAWGALAAMAALAVPAGAGEELDPAPAGRAAVQVSEREVLRAGAATIAMLALSSVDLMLARAVLPADDAGAYAVGSVLTRGALWAPGVITILALPMFAQARLYAVRITLALTAACGVVLVTVAAAANELAVGLAGGADYAHVSPYAGAFALVGAMYALVYVLVNAEIAAAMRRPALWLWAALLTIVAVTLVVRPSSVGGMLAIVVPTAAATTLLNALTFKLIRLRQQRAALQPAEEPTTA